MPVRVLIVDDSAFMRKMLGEIIQSNPGFELVGTARDGEDALQKVRQLKPDVVTMDVEMPNMTGEEALSRIMKESPARVVMLSSLTQAGSDMAVRCLAAGAIDVIGKPSGSTSLNISSISDQIIRTIEAASHARIRGGSESVAPSSPMGPSRSKSVGPKSVSLLVIGSSTGGPKALQTLVPMLPSDLGVPVVIVQHMPAQFTQSLAQRLDSCSPLHVREAEAGDRLSAGTVLMAPGGYHLTFDAAGRALLNVEPPIHGVRPSIDVTIGSLVPSYGPRMIAVLLTGMGRDGASGLKAVQSVGGATIAEHESTCVVYGMPKTAVEMGAADQVLPLESIGPAINEMAERGRSKAA